MYVYLGMNRLIFKKWRLTILLGDEIAHHKLAVYSEFMALFWFRPLGIRRISDLSIHLRAQILRF